MLDFRILKPYENLLENLLPEQIITSDHIYSKKHIVGVSLIVLYLTLELPCNTKFRIQYKNLVHT